MIELNRIYNECCLYTMGRMPDDFVDLTVTSPPWGDIRDFHGYNCSFDYRLTAQELYRVTKPGGVVVWVMGDTTINGSETLSSFKQVIYFKDVCGFNVHDTMIYQKAGAPYPGNKRYRQEFEYMFVLSKGSPSVFNPVKEKRNLQGIPSPKSFRQKNGSIKTEGKVQRENRKQRVLSSDCMTKSNIWRIPAGYMLSTQDQIAFNHPSIFPEKLVGNHICSWSNPGGTVYDPFMGSGTTAKMAIQYNRNFIGSEISAEYCKIANKRIAPCMKQIKLFEAI